MKRNSRVRPLILALLMLPFAALAEELDCFPTCAEPIKLDTSVALTGHDSIAAADGTTSTSCDSGLIKQAEVLNAKIKPIRDLVGFVRSPQGLAIKLVNDHIVKIPAWVGYAMDPIGSIKHRAIDEVRTQVKAAMNDDRVCDVTSAAASIDPAMNIYVGHSI